MTITILGASGRTGKELLREALERDIQVQALVRDPKKLEDYKDKVQLMQGDVLNYRAVQHVVAGSDAVISVLGHTKGSPKDLQLKALLHTLRAMHEHRVKRLIILTGSGVYTKEDKPPILVKLLNFVVKKVYKARVTDAQKLLPVLRASQTDWTVVRVNLLTDQDTSSYHVGLLGDKELKLRTSRKAVASFILDELESKTYVHKLPVVTN